MQVQSSRLDAHEGTESVGLLADGLSLADRERKIPILVTSLEERVLEDVRQRGAVTYSTLAKKYGDSVRDTLVELWKRGLLDIPVLEKYREILEKAENLDKLPPNLKGRLFATWQDRITGETYSELVIPPRARISARWAF